MPAWPATLAAVVLAAVLAACASGPSGAASPSGAGSPSGPGITSGPGFTNGGGAPSASPSDTAIPPAGAPSAAASTPPSPSVAGAPGTARPVWRSLADEEGPPAREDHTWTVDGGGGFAYLYGGRNGEQVFDDLWRYDLRSDVWEELQPGGREQPRARFGHTGNWVPGVGLVIWSGQQGSRFFNDLWAYDPEANAWQHVPVGGDTPSPRYGACGSVDADGRLWISHGFTDDGRFSDTRAFDFATGVWSDRTPSDQPVERCLHACLWTPDGRFVLYAGQTTGVAALGDLWAMAPADAMAGTWERQPDPQPPARQLYALAAVEDTAYVFGGGGEDGQKLGDLWLLDLRDLSWQRGDADGDPPSPRSGAAFVSDAVGGRLLLFGGLTDEGAAGDVWELTVR